MILATRDPLAPPLVGFPEGFFQIDGRRRRLIRVPIGELEGGGVACRHGEFAYGSEIFSLHRNTRTQNEKMRSGDGAQGSVTLAGNPGHGAPVIEPHDQIHVHAHAAAIAANHSYDFGMATPQRHEIDQRDRSRLSLKLRFEDQSSRTISATDGGLANGRYLPAAIL